MKTVSKINPEKEYETAKKLIEMASKQMLDKNNASTLDTSVDNLMTAARVLMEREERRRAHEHSTPPTNAKPKGRNKGDERDEAKKLPSVRYPELEIKETIVAPEQIPVCPCCNKEMKESGLFDVSEKLEVIPKQYYIQRI